MIKHRNGGVEYVAEGFIIHDVAGCAEDGDLVDVHGADVVGVVVLWSRGSGRSRRVGGCCGGDGVSCVVDAFGWGA